MGGGVVEERDDPLVHRFRLLGGGEHARGGKLRFLVSFLTLGALSLLNDGAVEYVGVFLLGRLAARAT